MWLLRDTWTLVANPQVDMTPWRWARPVAFSLLSLVVVLYVLFSPIGLADGVLGAGFYLAMGAILLINIGAWIIALPHSKRGVSGG